MSNNILTSLNYSMSDAERSEALRRHLLIENEKQEYHRQVQRKLAKEGKIILLDSSFYINEDHHLCQKCVDVGSIEIDGINTRDYPDFSDAYVSAAKWNDGTDLTEAELDELQDQHGDLVYEKVLLATEGMGE